MKQEILSTEQELKNYKDAEWVFQFDEDEPIVFAYSDKKNESLDDGGEITITIKSNSSSSITFSNTEKSKSLRIYSRPISEETIRDREKSLDK